MGSCATLAVHWMARVDPIIAELLKYGLAGIFIICLIYALKEERKDKNAEKVKNDTLTKELFTFYKASVDANVATAKATDDNTRATQAVAAGYQTTMATMNEILGILQQQRRR